MNARGYAKHQQAALERALLKRTQRAMDQVVRDLAHNQIALMPSLALGVQATQAELKPIQAAAKWVAANLAEMHTQKVAVQPIGTPTDERPLTFGSCKPNQTIRAKMQALEEAHRAQNAKLEAENRNLRHVATRRFFALWLSLHCLARTITQQFAVRLQAVTVAPFATPPPLEQRPQMQPNSPNASN